LDWIDDTNPAYPATGDSFKLADEPDAYEPYANRVEPVASDYLAELERDLYGAMGDHDP